MTELRVNLDFACPACHQPIGVTVQCAGDHLDESADVLATVAVPCPCCGHASKLTFGPDGTVYAVAPLHPPARLPEPSAN